MNLNEKTPNDKPNQPKKKEPPPKKKNSNNKKPPYSNKHTHPVKKTKPKKPEIHCPTPKQT